MVQKDHPQFNLGAIEVLKAATRQVIQPTPNNENSGESQSIPASLNFVEAFVGKITSIEQEKAKIEKEQLVIDQELARIEKLQLGLIEKKKQLEQRRNELIQVKNKLITLDKEISEVIKSPSL